MKKSILFSTIILFALSFSKCTSEDKQTDDLIESQSPIETEEITKLDKRVVVFDSILISLPSEWQIQIDTKEMFGVVSKCNQPFCENLVITYEGDISDYSKSELLEEFVDLTSDNFDSYHVLDKIPVYADSSLFEIHFKLKSQNIPIAGSTYTELYKRSALIYTFMGNYSSEDERKMNRQLFRDIMLSKHVIDD